MLAGMEHRYEQEHEANVNGTQRCFAVRATRFDWSGPARVVLALEDITEREIDRRYLELVTRDLRVMNDEAEEHTRLLTVRTKELEESQTRAEEMLAKAA